MKASVKVHGPTIVYALIIFIFSSISSLRGPDLGFVLQDKLLHVLEFGVLGFLLQRSIYYQYTVKLKSVLMVLILGIGYGGLDEIHQSFTVGREASISDFLADAVGIVLVCSIYLLIKWIKHR